MKKIIMLLGLTCVMLITLVGCNKKEKNSTMTGLVLIDQSIGQFTIKYNSELIRVGFDNASEEVKELAKSIKTGDEVEITYDGTVKEIIPRQIECISLKKTGQFNDDGFTSIMMKDALEVMKYYLDFKLVDVRTVEEYEEGHIAGAILLPLDEVEDNASISLPNKNERIYVYCRSGNRSLEAAEKLVQLGYTNVVEIGGMINYIEAIQE